MLKMIPLEVALTLLLDRVGAALPEKIELSAAHYRVLAREIYAPINQPPFNRSPLDGYAVLGADIANASGCAPTRLKVTETLPAGFVSKGRVEPGTAVRIMTGAPIPSGADTVVAIEDARETDGEVQIFVSLAPGSNLVQAGEDITQGELLLKQGTLLTAMETGVLSALGIASVEVFQRPRVAVLSTGDELIGLGEKLSPGKIYNSNLYSIAALIREVGGVPVLLGTVPDRVEETARKIAEGLAKADMVITTGGASVGDYDVIQDAIERVGARQLFWRIAMKPGTPVVAAQAGDKIILGLSGNPAAALISFEVLVRPLIRKMTGFANLYRPRAKVKLLENFRKKSSQRRFLRARVELVSGEWYASLAGAQNPGVLKSLLYTNALLDIPGSNTPLEAGTLVEAILLSDI